MFNSKEKINNLFLFISCQNISNTLRKEQLTNLFKIWIKKLSYPEQNIIINGISDFENIYIKVNVKNSLNNKIYNNILYSKWRSIK